MTEKKSKPLVGQRLRAYREAAGLSQDALAVRLGFAHRQTLAALEAGERRARPEELVRAAEALGIELDALTDPFRLVGEGEFSFRARDVDAARLADFEARAGRWIATYRELGRQRGVPPRRLGMRLELTPSSSFEAAADAADALGADWGLGEVPASGLEEAIESRLGTLVLYVDAPEGISGAASYLPGQHTILVNRRGAPGRRSYDLAHELFHLLTWEAMPPRRVEPWEPARTKGSRVEQLADHFAAALLMPRAAVEARWAVRGGEAVARWVGRTARELRVSAPALAWRLVDLGLLSRREREALPTPRSAPEAEPSPLFGARFVARVADAVEDGRLSLRRAAGLLDVTVEALLALCAVHGHPLPHDVDG